MGGYVAVSTSITIIIVIIKVGPLPVHSYEHATLALIDGTILSCRLSSTLSLIMMLIMLIMMIRSKTDMMMIIFLSGQLGLNCYQLSEDLGCWTFHSALPNSFDWHTRALATVLPSGAFLVLSHIS